jgi:hypothetical protein
MTKQGEHDFLNKQGIINLGESISGGQPIVHGQVLPLKPISYASLPTTGLPNRGLAYVPDHPIEGKTLVAWDGTAWVSMAKSTVNIAAANRALILPAGTGGPTSLGIALTLSGAFVGVQPTAGSFYNRAGRSTMTTTATAGNLSSFRSNIGRFWGGSVAGEGGWDVIINFGLSTLAAGMRCFLGLDSNNGTQTNIDPLASTTQSRVGVAINASTGNWNFISNLQGTIPTVISFAGCPVDTTSFYQFRMFRASGSSQINYEMINKTTNISTTGNIITNMAAATTFMTLAGSITNNATAAAAGFALGEVRVEWGS